MSLGRAVLTQNLAGTTFRYLQPLTHGLHTGTAAGGA
jgi:hypothetical protein